MSIFSTLNKILSVTKDVSTLASGDKNKIEKRVKNKVKAKLLHKGLNKVGFWSK